MLDEWELWAVANRVLEEHGDNIAAWLDQHVRMLAAKGDEAGVKTWLLISNRIDRLQQVPPASLRN